MTYQCEIKEHPAQPTLTIRTRTTIQDLPRLLGESYGTIGQYLGMQGKTPSGAPFAAYHNIDMQNLDVEIGFPVATPVPGKDNIQAGEMPAGKYASCLFTGPYSEMEAVYAALTQFIQEQGYQATGIAYEIYLNPTDTPPEALQTQIQFPLKTT